MEKRMASAAIFVCAVMALVAAAPLVAGDIHDITKLAKGPNASAVTWSYTPTDYGMWHAQITNNGLRWMVIEVFDNSNGAPVQISREHIRFAAVNAYPTGITDSTPVVMALGHTYEITAIPNGPKGSTAIVEDMFDTKAPPVAQFTATMNWMEVTADGGASYDQDLGTVVSWDWTWGDGATGSGEVATHTYLAEGTFTITLVVTDNDGLESDPATQQVTAIMQPPTINAVFTPTMTWMVVSVDASASTGALPLTYTWDFGDGATGTGVTATHEYAAEGTYTISLLVVDATLATDTATAQVTAQMQPALLPPTANIVSNIVYLDLAVDGSGSSDADGTVVAWAWNFGDGSTASTAIANHKYAAAGEYTVTLVVTDNDGLTGTASKLVTATEPPKPPIADFTVSDDYLVVTVDASPSYDPDGTVVAWAWDFGDGATATVKATTHTYAAAGTYSITLTVTDSQGLTGTISKSVTVVANTPPVADFTFTVNGQTVSFVSTSTDDRGIASWSWDLGDGTTGSGETVSHTFGPALSVHVISAAGVLVPIPPYSLVGFTYGPDGTTPMTNSVVTIKNEANGLTMSAVSDPEFGIILDPITGSYPDLNQISAVSGNVITLTATNGGFSGTASATVPSPPGGQLDLSVTLTGGTGPTPHDFTVTLTVVDGYGLSNSVSKTVTVMY